MLINKIKNIKPLFLGLLAQLCLISTIGQTVTNKTVVYETKIKYKQNNPTLNKKSFNKSTVREIIELATDDHRSQKEIDSILNLIWNAMVNPVEFDYLFKDFSHKTLGSGHSIKPDGTIVKEPKPFLAEWSVADSEIGYFQFVINFILTEFNAISYGDDSEGVQAAFYQILQTRKVNIDSAKFNGSVYNYLKDINKKNLSKNR